MDAERIQGERIFLRLLTAGDDLGSYCAWMNDKEILRFTESKGKSYTEDDLKKYITAMNGGNNRLYGIFLKESGRHIGNIKLGEIDTVNKRAHIGIIIGEKDLWGRGFATEAIGLLADSGFRHLQLRRIYAGMYANNPASLKSFLKAGFRRCGLLTDHVFFEGQFIDSIMVEKINPELERINTHL